MRKLAGFSIAVILALLVTTALTESWAAQPMPAMGPTARQQSRQCPPKGGCPTAVTTFGYYEPKWSQWPGEQRLEKINPSAIGREQLLPPPPTQGLLPYAPYPQQGPNEQGLLPGELPSREVVPPGGLLPPGDILPPGGTSLPSGILPPGGTLTPGAGTEPSPGLETPAETETIPGLPSGGLQGLPGGSAEPTPAPSKPAANSKEPDAPPPSGLPLDPTGRMNRPQPQQGQTNIAPPAPQPSRIPWQEVPEEPAAPVTPEWRQTPETDGLGQAPAAAPSNVSARQEIPARYPEAGVAQASSDAGYTVAESARQASPARYPEAGVAQASSEAGYTVAESAQQVAGNLPIDMPQDAATHASVYEQAAGLPEETVDRAWQGQQSPLAMEGFCPVDLGKNERWTKGDARWAVVHEGQTYLLSGPVQRECFLVDPQRYIPAGGGFDPVVLKDEGRKAAGTVDYCVTYDGKLYMFSNAASLAKFRQDARQYTVR